MTPPGQPTGALVAAAGSPAAPLAAGLAWLWGLAGQPAAVGIGTQAEREGLEAQVADGGLRGAVVFSDGARRGRGEASWPGGMRLRGDFGLLPSDGDGWAESSLGVHAALDGDILEIAAPADGEWGSLRFAWVADALSRFFSDRMGLTLERLPQIGCLRLDDIPGTAEFQLEGRAKGDGEGERLAKRLARAAADSGAVLNVAVACQALGEDREIVPLEDVWPGSIAALRAGVEAGAIEPVCHGRLGLVPEALERGEIDYHEYGHLGEEEALAVLREVVAWQRANLGEAPTFVAVDWTYSEGTRAAARSLGLTAWLKPEPGPLAGEDFVRETLVGRLDGIAALDFSPLRRLAELGVPPTVTLHGRSLDRRRESFDLPRDALSLAAAFAKRDIYRLLEIEGVRWLGAAEFAKAVASHSSRVEASAG